MVDVEAFRTLALSHTDATEEPHFAKVSFRIQKKIFATLDLERKTAVLKLTEELQANYAAQHESIIYPVKGAWGKQGWTTVELNHVSEPLLTQVLADAYTTVCNKK